MKNKILTAVSILLGLMFINSGLNKFFNYLPVPADMPEVMINMMGAMMQITWLMPLVAVVEILGGALLFFGRFRALGALMLFPIMVGIILTHVVGGGLPLALVFAAILGWIMYENLAKYKPLIQ